MDVHKTSHSSSVACKSSKISSLWDPAPQYSLMVRLELERHIRLLVAANNRLESEKMVEAEDRRNSN